MTTKMEACIFLVLVGSILLRLLWGHTPLRALVLMLVFLEAAIQQALKSSFVALEHYRTGFLGTFREERQSLGPSELTIMPKRMVER